jgi:hypothetical protein
VAHIDQASKPNKVLGRDPALPADEARGLVERIRSFYGTRGAAIKIEVLLQPTNDRRGCVRVVRSNIGALMGPPK